MWSRYHVDNEDRSGPQQCDVERIHHAHADHCNHRQPERQARSKRGALLDLQGFDAGKKITGRKRHSSSIRSAYC